MKRKLFIANLTSYSFGLESCDQWKPLLEWLLLTLIEVQCLNHYFHGISFINYKTISRYPFSDTPISCLSLFNQSKFRTWLSQNWYQEG